MSAPAEAPRGVRIAHPDGTSTPVEVTFLGSEPLDHQGEIYIVDRYQITTKTFVSDGDRIEADWMPPACSFVHMHVGVR